MVPHRVDAQTYFKSDLLQRLILGAESRDPRPLLLLVCLPFLLPWRTGWTSAFAVTAFIANEMPTAIFGTNLILTNK